MSPLRTEPSWGLALISFAMVVLHLLFIALDGPRASHSLYAALWSYLSFLAIQGNLKRLAAWIGPILILNVAVVAVVSLLTSDRDLQFVLGLSRGELVLGGVVALTVQLIVYLWAKSLIADEAGSGRLSADIPGRLSPPPAASTWLYATPEAQVAQDADEAGSGRLSADIPDRLSPPPAASTWLYATPEAQLSQEQVETSTTSIITPSTVRVRNSSSPTTETDEYRFFEQALTEFESDKRLRGLWAMVFAKAGGDENRAKAKYLDIRADQLRSEAERSAPAQTQTDAP